MFRSSPKSISFRRFTNEPELKDPMVSFIVQIISAKIYTLFKFVCHWCNYGNFRPGVSTERIRRAHLLKHNNNNNK